MERPWLLDLFCGAGGAGEGYRRAGFHVVGVDIDPKPLRHNPHECYQGDALEVLDTLLAGREWQGYRLHDFQAIHASPPCQGYSVTKGQARKARTTWKPLVSLVAARCQLAGVPYVVENVAGARVEMPGNVMLCGTQFGLPIYRHRYFESNYLLLCPPHPRHPSALMDGYVCVYGHTVHTRQTGNKGNRYQTMPAGVGRQAMGIDWMPLSCLSQAIPPAYTHWIGRQLLAALEHAA